MEQFSLIFFSFVNVQRNCALSASDMVLLALRFYASGSFLLTVADYCGVSVATASRVVKKVSTAIAKLGQRFIEMPSSNEEIMDVSNRFYNIAKFPKVIGCVDGTHIRIQSPGGDDAEIYRNRKGFFSFNVQVVWYLCNFILFNQSSY